MFLHASCRLSELFCCQLLGLNMSSLVESAHHFKLRCTEVGLSRETLRAFADHGIDTLSKLAYSCGQPGTPLPQTEFDDFVASLIPAAERKCQAAAF